MSVAVPGLFATKLVPPRARARHIARPRLHALLDRGAEEKLILISTPPGYGKSTLLAQWIATSSMPAAWLSIDESDNDAPAFFRYLAAAFQTVDPQTFVEVSRLLGATQP